MSEPNSTAPPADAHGPQAAASPPPGPAPWERTVGGIRVIFGEGMLERLGEMVAEVGGRRVLLVTDPGLRRAGHVASAEAALRKESLEVRVFDGVEANPTTRHVEAGTRLAREAGIDSLVGLGGGSPMDCAKGINFLLTNGGRMEDYRGTGKASRPLLPAVGVPTTAGTGSDAQSYALIAREEDHEKMACGDPKARFATVILDPALTATLPRWTTAVTGLDAIAHALESYVCTRAGGEARAEAREAWQLLEGAFQRVLDSPADGDARGRMLWGAHLAGAAVEASMLGAAHACANPLSARYGLEHGVAVALMLPQVIRLNGDVAGDLYAELAGSAAATGAVETLARRVEELRAAGSLPSRLRDAGIEKESLPELARSAAGQWTARFNPAPVGAEQLGGLYEAAF
jgi:alcohol dehydrogenase